MRIPHVSLIETNKKRNQSGHLAAQGQYHLLSLKHLNPSSLSLLPLSWCICMFSYTWERTWKRCIDRDRRQQQSKQRAYFRRSDDEADPLLSLNKRGVRSFGLLDRWDRYTLHFVLGWSKTSCCSFSCGQAGPD